MNEAGDIPSGGLDRRTAHTGMLVLFDQAAISVANFLTGLLVGRVCTAAEFGAYTLAFAALNAVGGFQNALVLTPMTVLSSGREGADLRRYFGGSLAVQALLSGATALAGLTAVAALAWLRPGSPYLGAFFGASVAVFFEQMQEFVRRLLLARLRAAPALFNDALCSALRLGLLAALVAWSRRTADPSLLTSRNAWFAVAAAALLAGAAGLLQIRSLVAAPLASARAAARENWGFGRWSLASAALGAVGLQLFPWILAAARGPAEVGALGACLTLVHATNPLLNAFGSLFAPITATRFAREGLPALRRATRAYVLLNAATIGGLLLVLVLARDPLLHLVYVGRYDGRGLLLASLAGAALLAALDQPFAFALNSMRRPDVGFATHALTLAFTAALAWPLVRHFGAYGVALGAALGSALGLAVRATILARAEKLVPARAPESPRS